MRKTTISTASAADCMAASRRSFLKASALVAAPLALIAPATVLADDGSAKEHTHLQDERALTRLTRETLSQLNTDSEGQCKTLTGAGCAVETVPHLRHIAITDTANQALEEQIEWTKNRLSARLRLACETQEELFYTGNSEVERIARFQGHGNHLTSKERALELAFNKGEQGWQLVRLQIT